MSAGPRPGAPPAQPDPGPLTRLLLPSPAREKLNQVANVVYQRMDQLYQGKMYFPGKGATAAHGELRQSPPAPGHLRSARQLCVTSPLLPSRHQGIFPTSCELSSGSRCTSSRMPSSKVSKRGLVGREGAAAQGLRTQGHASISVSFQAWGPGQVVVRLE